MDANDKSPQSGPNTPTKTFNRREFIGGMAAASAAFTVVPRRVLGGAGFAAPSDRLNVAQIGCGTQGIRQVTTGLATREDLQFTCVCDPNTDSSNYVDWSRDGLRNRVSAFLQDENWGANEKGIRAGREVAREILERYYGQVSGSGSYEGVRSYADFRELFAQESDLDAVVIVTPDHTHASISIAALQNDVSAILHKPISNVLNEVRATVVAAKESSAATHLMAYRDREDYDKLARWIKSGVIGPVREIHNWTFRPVWPQGWLDYPTETPAVPEGFDWELWQGPVPHRPYHPHYTFALYRGWFDYGGGSFADMGNYTLWAIYQMLELDPPTRVLARPNSVPLLTEENVSQTRISEVAFPLAGTARFHHPENASRPAVDVYWYEGGIRPQTPQELRDAGEELDPEGMLFVGDEGKILCSFRGDNPRLLHRGLRLEEVDDPRDTEAVEIVEPDDEWINAVKNGGKSRGSFETFENLAEATALYGLAMRMPGRELEWDSASMQITNVPEANKLVRRTYRPGWEI